MFKETQNKHPCRHAGENRHPVNNCLDWIPAFAGMTTGFALTLNQSFIKRNIN